MASGGSASATVAASRRRLIADFIFEVADSGGETTVGSHVGVAEQTETQLEVEGFGEHLFLEDPGADNLARDGDEHFVFARGENVNFGNSFPGDTHGSRAVAGGRFTRAEFGGFHSVSNSGL